MNLRFLRFVGIIGLLVGARTASAVEIQTPSFALEAEAKTADQDGVCIHYGSESLGQSVSRLLTDCGSQRTVSLSRVTLHEGRVGGLALPHAPDYDPHGNPCVVLFFDPESEDQLQSLWRERLTNHGVRTVPVLFERSRTSAFEREKMLTRLHAALVDCLPQDRVTLRRNLQRELLSSSNSVISVVASGSMEP